MRGPTTDHREIRLWAQGCQATPVEVHTRIHDGEPAQLRFIFGELARAATEEELRPISWEQFFAMFDVLELAMVYDQGRQYELLQTNKRPLVQEGKMEHQHDGEGRLSAGLAAAAQESEPQKREDKGADDSKQKQGA